MKHIATTLGLFAIAAALIGFVLWARSPKETVRIIERRQDELPWAPAWTNIPHGPTDAFCVEDTKTTCCFGIHGEGRWATVSNRCVNRDDHDEEKKR